MPSYYYSSLLQYSDRTVQNMGSDLFPLHHLLRSDPQGSAPIFALKGSKIGPPSQNQAPLPYFLRSKQPKKPVLVDVAFVMKKLAEKVVFPVFFFYSLSFSLPLFLLKRVQTCFAHLRSLDRVFFPLFCFVVAWYSRHAVVGCERESITGVGCFRLGLPNFVRWASAVVTMNWV